jgi:hypothetical protein
MSGRNSHRFNGQYVVASIYINPDGATAQFVSVRAHTVFRKIRVPPQFVETLLTGKSSPHQIRFRVQFESARADNRLVVSDVIAVPLDEYEHAEPVPTVVNVSLSASEPFDFEANVWSADCHRLAHRFASSSLRVELYYKCLSLLKEQGDLSDGAEALRIEAEVHASDADLFDQSVSLERWLLRATLRTSYCLSLDQPEKRLVMRCRNEAQRRNIQRLRRALSAVSPLPEFASSLAEEHPETGESGRYARTEHHLIHGAGCRGHRESRDANDMLCALRELRTQHGSDDHPYVVSFQEARRRRNIASLDSIGSARELELPYVLFKEPDSFETPKVYMVMVCDALKGLAQTLQPNSLLSTTVIPCKSSSWTPHLQHLLDEADRDPEDFYERHPGGLVGFNERSPMSLTLVPNTESFEAGGAWFLRHIHPEHLGPSPAAAHAGGGSGAALDLRNPGPGCGQDSRTDKDTPQSVPPQGQYVIASFDVPSKPGADAQAHLVSVSCPTDVLAVVVPSRFHPLLMCAKTEPTQPRFLFTFAPSEVAGSPPCVSDAERVELDGSEQQIVTFVGCWWCLEEPFDFSTGEWAPTIRNFLVRNSTTTVRGIVSERCTQVLRAREALPAQHPLFRFDAVSDYRESDADLFQPVAPQRWLDRAVLPDVWRKSAWGNASGRLPNCPPGSVQESNIQMLRDSFISSCSAAFTSFLESSTGELSSRYFMSFSGSSARGTHGILNRAGESHMDNVLRNLQQDCWGDGHSLTSSFQRARRLRNSAGDGPERELPFIVIPKRAGSFQVRKEYPIRIHDSELNHLELSSNALALTTGFDCRTYDCSHWTPYFQELVEEADRLGPRDFRRRHPQGLVFGDFRQRSHATQVCLRDMADFVARCGACFRELYRRTEGELSLLEQELAALELKHDS